MAKKGKFEDHPPSANFLASRIFFESSPDGIVVTGSDGCVRAANRAFAFSLGYTLEAVHRLALWDWEPRFSRTAYAEEFRTASLAPRTNETHFTRKDGTEFEVELVTWFDEFEGEQLRFAMCRDITSRKREDRAYRENNALLQLILDAVPAMIFFKDREHRIVSVNQEFTRLVGIPRSQIEGHTDSELASPHAEQYAQDERTVIETRREVRGIFEPIETSKGRRWLLTDKLPHIDHAGEVTGIVGFSIDITERKAAEDALRAGESRLRLALEAAGMGVWEIRLPNGEVHWSESYCLLLGIAPERSPRTQEEFLAFIHADDRASVAKALRNAADGAGEFRCEFRVTRADGAIRRHSALGCLQHDELSETDRILGVGYDVTDRYEMERRLREAERLEAVGRLAGGVAHDFNNFLCVVGLNAQTLLETTPANHEDYEPLAEIVGAYRRAANLTQQLLTFGRGRLLQPVRFDLGQSVLELRRMLCTLAGPAVAIEIIPVGEPSFIEADREQIEQAIVNLVVNARDAIAARGRIKIYVEAIRIGEPHRPPRCEELAPGQYVMLSVADDGCGIAAENLDRIFDPFYTSKPLGKGTGLGLAVVHGIVAQHRGVVAVESTVGIGSIFRIYLPAAGRESAVSPAPDSRTMR